MEIEGTYDPDAGLGDDCCACCSTLAISIRPDSKEHEYKSEEEKYQARNSTLWLFHPAGSHPQLVQAKARLQPCPALRGSLRGCLLPKT